MGLFDRLVSRWNRRQGWKAPFEGSITPPGYRPPGWEYPPKKKGDSDIIVVNGESDGTHTITRFPQSSFGPERKG